MGKKNKQNGKRVPLEGTPKSAQSSTAVEIRRVILPESTHIIKLPDSTKSKPTMIQGVDGGTLKLIREQIAKAVASAMSPEKKTSWIKDFKQNQCELMNLDMVVLDKMLETTGKEEIGMHLRELSREAKVDNTTLLRDFGDALTYWTESDFGSGEWTWYGAICWELAGKLKLITPPVSEKGGPKTYGYLWMFTNARVLAHLPNRELHQALGDFGPVDYGWEGDGKRRAYSLRNMTSPKSNGGRYYPVDSCIERDATGKLIPLDWSFVNEINESEG